MFEQQRRRLLGTPRAQGPLLFSQLNRLISDSQVSSLAPVPLLTRGGKVEGVDKSGLFLLSLLARHIYSHFLVINGPISFTEPKSNVLSTLLWLKKTVNQFQYSFILNHIITVPIWR